MQIAWDAANRPGSSSDWRCYAQWIVTCVECRFRQYFSRPGGMESDNTGMPSNSPVSFCDRFAASVPSVSLGPPPDIRKGSREPPQGLDRDPIQQCKRRRATLPHPLKCSTIAVQGLSFRVRNGTGRLTLAMVAANLQPITTPAGGRRHVAVREPDNGREFVPWTKRMLPAEGTSRRTQYGQHQEQAWCVV